MKFIKKEKIDVEICLYIITYKLEFLLCLSHKKTHPVYCMGYTLV